MKLKSNPIIGYIQISISIKVKYDGINNFFEVVMDFSKESSLVTVGEIFLRWQGVLFPAEQQNYEFEF